MNRVLVDSLVLSDESGFACSKSKLVQSGVRHLRPFNIGDDGQLDLSEVYQVPESEAPAKKTRLEAGDILFNNTNSSELVGKAALVPNTMDAGFSNHLSRIRLNANLVEPAYFAFWLRRLREQGFFTAQATRWVSQAAYKTSELRKIEIALPPLPEQRRIVDLLSRAEGIVRLRREAEKKAAELIPALFLDMFGDPATNPKGWPSIKLSEVIAEPPTLGTMAKPSATHGKWLDLRVANIQGGQLTLRDRKWVDLPNDQVDRFALRSGDVVLARAIGSLDHLGKAVVVSPDGDWTFDSHLMRVRLVRSRLLPEVFKCFLESAGGREEFLKHTRRSAVQFNINGKELREIRLPLPPLSVQESFVREIESLRAIQSQQSAAAIKAQAAFDALLAQVFVP